jgi:hypothetical protein
LLAAGLAASRQGDLAGLALLATPWDFHAGEASSVLVAANRLPLASTIATLGCAPVDMLQFFSRCSIRSRSFANTYALPIFGPTTHERAFSWPWKTG